MKTEANIFFSLKILKCFIEKIQRPVQIEEQRKEMEEEEEEKSAYNRQQQQQQQRQILYLMKSTHARTFLFYFVYVCERASNNVIYEW